MSMIVRLAIVAVLAASALAQSCNANVTLANPYHRSNCTGYRTCEQSLCACTGIAYSANRTAETCVVGSTLGCESFTACVKTYFTCLDGLTSARSDASDPCYSWAVNLHTALLETAVSSYNGSKVQEYCGIAACHLRNASNKNSCPMGTNFSSVCQARLQRQRVVQGSLRLGGSNWSSCVTNATCRQSISQGITKDLSELLGIPAELLEIISVRVGSLIVDFAILEGSNKTAASLLTAIQATGSNSSWLRTVRSVYATVSSEPLTVEGFTAAIVTTTLAGTTNAPSTTPSTTAPSISAASPVPVFVALAAAFALLL
jgi:hypothetical protein